jgi:diguanylate cyclase (GGDEF)-like protein
LTPSEAIIVLGVSVLAQMAAALIALRQMTTVSGRYCLAWGCISFALVFMVQRRLAPLWRLFEGELTNDVDAVVGLLISLLMFAGMIGVRRLFLELKWQSAALEKMACTDCLTGLSNRRDILNRAEAELDRCLRTSRPVSLLLLDLDRFKAVNDTYGHAAGDAVLGAVAAAGRATLRRIDSFGRMGGEEFLIVLPETNGDEALTAADRLRLAIASAQIDAKEGRLSVSASIGVVTHEADNTLRRPAILLLEELLGIADEALYEAKATGRNRTVVACRSHRTPRHATGDSQKPEAPSLVREANALVCERNAA